MPPSGLHLCEPIAVSLQTELQQPVGLALLLRDEANHVFVQTLFDDFSVYVGGEAKLVLLLSHTAYKLVLLAHSFFFDGMIFSVALSTTGFKPYLGS